MLRLVYRPRQNLRELFDSPNPETIIRYLDSKNSYTRPFLGSVALKVRRELQTKNIDDLAQMIFSAVEAAKSLSIRTTGLDSTKHHPDSLSIPFELDSIRREFFALQAVTILRHFEIVNLTHCELNRSRHSLPLDIANASSGEQQMLCSIFGIASAIRDNCLVLIDEPELSLHPQRQIDFIEAITAILKLVNGCHIIISTHSPVVVQAAQAVGASITQLGDFNSVSLTPREHNSISVEQALVDVFETPISASAHVSNQIFKAVVSAETGGDWKRMPH